MTYPLMYKLLFSLILVLNLLNAININFSGSLKSDYGSSYDFYDISENIIDLNFFSDDFQGWLQYEYSNPPDIGFTTNDIRKFRLEYSKNNFNVKLGDIYEMWGRGLVLNQFDDQIINFDNGTRGLYLEFNKGPYSFSQINGVSDIWLMGAGNRVPDLNNFHNMAASKLNYSNGKFSLGLMSLRSNEEHQKMFGSDALVNHNIKGAYFTWLGPNADIFLEYADKISTEKTNLFENIPNDTIKKGSGYYQNINLYLKNWGLSTEYKRYSFDKAHGEFTANDYGNQIEYQQMPTLVMEHNSTLLNRVTHNNNFNDERGLQVALSGNIQNLSILAQYAHLSRNEEWQSISGYEWVHSSLKNILPSSSPSALPFWENYFELSGYALDDKLYFKIGTGRTKEILKTIRFFNGLQRDQSIDTFWTYDTTDTVFYGQEYKIIDSLEIFDTTFSQYYSVESKLWNQKKAFTLPLELNYSFDSGYGLQIGFQYQEIKNVDRAIGNATSFSSSDSSWIMFNSEDFNEYYDSSSTNLFNADGLVGKQFNRLLSITVSKAHKWSFTVSQDWTNAYEEWMPTDSYYNPLEAIVSGDYKYIFGKRNKTAIPSWLKNRWISAEFIYNINSSQRLSIMYGSIMGGLFCSNGICRIIPAFNDGLKISYSATF